MCTSIFIMDYRKILYFHWTPAWVFQAIYMTTAVDIYHIFK
jgi:hypothetical protein